MINDWGDGMWKETVVAYLNVLSRYLLKLTEKNHENSQSDDQMSQSEFEPGASRIQGRSLTARANFLCNRNPNFSLGHVYKRSVHNRISKFTRQLSVEAFNAKFHWNQLSTFRKRNRNTQADRKIKDRLRPPLCLNFTSFVQLTHINYIRDEINSSRRGHLIANLQHDAGAAFNSIYICSKKCKNGKHFELK
jgi:hypothetical protein